MPVWGAPGHLPGRRGLGQAEPLDPCPVSYVNTVGAAPSPDPGVRAAPAHPAEAPPVSVPSSDTVTVSLQASSGRGRPVLSGPRGPGLGPAHPENPVLGAREGKGSPGVTAGKKLALQRPPLPLPGRASWFLL